MLLSVRMLTRAQILIASLLLWATAFSAAAKGTPPGADLFTNGPIPHLEVQISKAAMDSLRRDYRKPVPITLKEGARVYTNVLAHVKGSAGSLRPVDDRPALTLSFGGTNSQERFHGLRKIHLNNSVQDPAYMDEQLAGELFRAAGVPAARTAHAVVRINARTLGIYVLKEGFSKDFLGQYFSKTDGNLYDGGFCAEIGQQTQKVGGTGPDDRSDLKAVLAAAQEADPVKCWQRLNETVEMERFISMMALECLTQHWDGYSAKANNYRVYINPENKKAVFFVHGMDQMFGRGGEVQYSITPRVGGAVATAVMRTPQGRSKYMRRLQEIFHEQYQYPALVSRINELAKPVRAEFTAHHPEGLAEYDAQIRELSERLKNRCADVAKQLAAAGVQ